MTPDKKINTKDLPDPEAVGDPKPAQEEFIDKSSTKKDKEDQQPPDSDIETSDKA